MYRCHTKVVMSDVPLDLLLQKRYLASTMKVTRDDVSKIKVKLTVELLPEELAPHMERAAKHVSEHVDIAGFRKGHATYDVVKERVGEQAILEEAAEIIIHDTLPDVIVKESLRVSGRPEVHVEKMAPGNPFIYVATVELMPHILKLADYKKLTVNKKLREVEEKDIELALKDLARMQTKETRALSGHAATVEDLVVADTHMTKAGVPVEGGDGKGWRIYLNETDTYVPGMREPLLGMKEGEEKTFEVTFPEGHYQKHLAGQKVQMAVKVIEVFNLVMPIMDDEFAKQLGQESFVELRDKIKENLQKEKDEEVQAEEERAMLELLAKETLFSEIGESLIEEEVDKMAHELEHAVERQGGVFADYLTAIGKTQKTLREGMKPQAELRVKVALVLEKVSDEEKIEVSDDEAKTEIQKQAEYYKDAEQKKKLVESISYLAYTKGRMRNAKTMQKLRELMLK